MIFAGSLVFTPPRQPVDLRDWSQWWKLLKGADWRHPYGPKSSINNLDNHPVVHVAFSDALACAKWAGAILLMFVFLYVERALLAIPGLPQGPTNPGIAKAAGHSGEHGTTRPGDPPSVFPDPTRMFCPRNSTPLAKEPPSPTSHSNWSLRTEVSVAGKRNLQGRDKEAETASKVQGRRYVRS